MRKIKQEENKESIVDIQEKTSQHSTLIFFIVKENNLHYLVPDYELYSCKEIFQAYSCHESYFGLARLYCFESKFEKALETIEKALKISQDTTYKLWELMLKAKTKYHAEIDSMQTKSIFRSFSCCSSVKSHSSIIELLEIIPESVEMLWSCMEISMKGLGNLERPEYYANKIKNLQSYLGYLAWGEIFFRRNEWQKGIDILKQIINTYKSRPEAYLRLWYHYYYNVKDYEQAYTIIFEALIMIKTSESQIFYILFNIYTAKSLFKIKKIKECLNSLQRNFIDSPTYPVFLYEFGKYSTKSEDYFYNGPAIGALQECIRLCNSSRYGLIYYWLAKAYMLGRHHIDAYDTVKLALDYLDPSRTKKMLELKTWIIEIHPNIQKIKKIEEMLSKEFTESDYKKCKDLCNEMKDFHKLTADVLYAKMLWKTGRHEEALKKLYAVSGISTVKMTAHFLLIQYLKEQNEIKCMKTVACEMVVKCKNPQVPAHIWMKVNLLYAKILVKNNKPGKAILILKCMAKILSPMPFADITYTKVLRRASNLQDLTTAYVKTIDSYSPYCYSSYKNSFVTGPSDVREFSQKLIAKEAAPLPISDSRRYKHRKSERNATEEFIPSRIYRTKKTQDYLNEPSEEKKDATILGTPINKYSEFISLSLCSDPTFLYKIAKISISNHILVQDGYCAIKDYIELLKFEKNIQERQKKLDKAEKIKSAICEIKDRY
jgi:tetratricopeptide (TPR) repeat protein